MLKYFEVYTIKEWYKYYQKADYLEKGLCLNVEINCKIGLSVKKLFILSSKSKTILSPECTVNLKTAQHISDSV